MRTILLLDFAMVLSRSQFMSRLYGDSSHFSTLRATGPSSLLLRVSDDRHPHGLKKLGPVI